MKRATLAVAAFSLFTAGAVRAGSVTFYSVFKNITYQQTSNVAPTNPFGFFVNGGVSSDTANDLTGGTIRYPGPESPIPLTISNPNTLGFAFSYPTRAAMETAFPDGNIYTFNVNTVSTPNTRVDTLVSPANSLFTATVPFIKNFSGLQGMNPAAPFTVLFPSIAPVGVSNDSNIFFSIFGALGTRLDDSANSFQIAANALMPNTTYTFELDYSNRLDTPASGGFVGATGIAGYDVRATGTFTTGLAVVPEPSTLTLLGVCAAGLVCRRWWANRPA